MFIIRFYRWIIREIRFRRHMRKMRKENPYTY